MKILSLLLIVTGLFGRVPGEENGEKEDVGTVVGIDLGTTYSWLVIVSKSGNTRN